MSRRRNWMLEPEVDPALIAQLARETGYATAFLKLAVRRGLQTGEELQRFLNPQFKDLTEISRFKDLEPLAYFLANLRDEKKTVFIVGDYDVDGTCGAALLTLGFREMGLDVRVKQPDRFQDGYGLAPRFAEEAHQTGASLLLSIDCGITSFEALQRAKDLGMASAVVDHHQVAAQGLPPAQFIVNPQQETCPSDAKELCGCGLGFFVLIALRVEGRRRGWFTGEEPNLKKHLDLVALATACDMVPLLKNNHILIRKGLEVLKETTKPGLRALLDVSGLASKDFSPSHLGFSLGPRINASGRMQEAATALDLLLTTCPLSATQLAKALDQLNQERASVQNKIWDEIRPTLEIQIKEGLFQHGIVLFGPHWHEGVLGIVASRVVEHFHRPAVVLALDQKEASIKGSVRSFAGKNVLEALKANQSLLQGFGGHQHAAGCRLELKNLEAFQKGFDASCKDLPVSESLAVLRIDGSWDWSELTPSAARQIEAFGPYGTGHPEPLWLLEAKAEHVQLVKERHVRMILSSTKEQAKPVDFSRAPERIKAIWFHAPLTQVKNADSWVGHLEINRFKGKEDLHFRIRDAKSTLPLGLDEPLTPSH
jgi:single-stranded-DNA-specific exonuclease